MSCLRRPPVWGFTQSLDVPTPLITDTIQRKASMRSQINFALAHPVFDPDRDIVVGHYWRATRDISACLTVNIGEE